MTPYGHHEDERGHRGGRPTEAKRMDPYGEKAQRHWARWLPKRHRDVEDPEAFFTALGEEAEDEVITLAAALAGADRPGETFMEKRGRLNMARLNAESQILAGIVLLLPRTAVPRRNWPPVARTTSARVRGQRSRRGVGGSATERVDPLGPADERLTVSCKP